MSVTIATIDFDRVDYDRDADVLYLSVGDPANAVDFDETPDGHALRYNARGELIGITIVGARRLADQQTRRPPPSADHAVRRRARVDDRVMR